ncbi:MAG: hypothetical protein KAJ12_12605 [Bacteroidetes bacterium]|nr:hypothetical protein [Bacteroidota bacterium]
MLEKETEQIISTLAERTIGRRESITLKDALAAEMPKAVKVYMRTEVIRWLKTDMDSAPRFGKVNRNAPGINQLTVAFLRSLADAYQFTRNEFLTLLDDAVHFVENYLCRPQWTLENFLFDNKDSVSADNLFFRLGYTVEYSYFGRLIQKLVRQWGWKKVQAEDFRALISKIDNQVVRQHSPRELGMLTKPIFDFLLLSDAPLTRAIPLDPILLFFEDKKMSELKDHIERVCGIRERSELTIKEVIGLIQDFHSEPGETDQKPEEKPVMEKPVAEPEPEEDVAEPPVKPPEEPREQTAEPAQVSEEAIQLAISSDETEETLVGSEEAGLPDLNDLISKRQRSRFIRKLFKKDKDYFDEVIEELNRTPTWKEASQYLTRVYEVNNLDPFSEDVIRFTDIIQSRFANTET